MFKFCNQIVNADCLKELKKIPDETFDLILTPTTPQSAFNIEKEQPLNQANFTSLANISDLPAISLPHNGTYEQPFSIQLNAANNNDKILLKISSIFEKILQ